jgi:hypothetical protein
VVSQATHPPSVASGDPVPSSILSATRGFQITLSESPSSDLGSRSAAHVATVGHTLPLLPPQTITLDPYLQGTKANWDMSPPQRTCTVSILSGSSQAPDMSGRRGVGKVHSGHSGPSAATQNDNCHSKKSQGAGDKGAAMEPLTPRTSAYIPHLACPSFALKASCYLLKPVFRQDCDPW